MLIWRYSDL